MSCSLALVHPRYGSLSTSESDEVKRTNHLALGTETAGQLSVFEAEVTRLVQRCVFR